MQSKAAKQNTEKRKLRASDIAVMAVFIGFIAVFSLLLLFLPKHEGEVSPNERRVLAEAPKLTSSKLFSGSFAKDVDSWLEDHFPGRTAFVSVYNWLNRKTGRNAVEEIIVCKNDRLVERPIAADEENISFNIEKLRTFTEGKPLRSFSYIIPTSGYMLEEDLPKPHLNYIDGELIKRFADELAGSITPLSAEETLRAYGDVRELYYRTDHHLTMRGSYVSYCAIAEKLGFEPLPESEFTKTGYDFYGTYYGRSGLSGIPADTLETWVAPYDSSLTVRIATLNGKGELSEVVHTGSLDTSKLAPDVTDRYAAYLYSNNGVTIIENEAVESGCLLVVKDSYGNALVPFLAAHYRTIVMLDLRMSYYDFHFATPTELCEQYGVQDFLLLVGLDTVVNSTLNYLK